MNLGIYSYFNGIVDRRSLVSYGDINRGKSEILKIVSKKFKIPMKNILFADDQETVIEHLTCPSLFVIHKQGITVNDMLTIAKFFNIDWEQKE